MEMHDEERDACDVIVEMDDGSLCTALFVTLPYLQRQMKLSYDMSKQLNDTPAVPYAAMETPHVLVESLDRDVIEDTIDNLLALEVFETIFTPVSRPNPVEAETTDTIGIDDRATQEVAAVVLSDVLVVEE
ncbi:MAG: hypothetical protein D6737_12760 [Chloroflexi bacterium]|nr:MAG: hypothetical protein D6737_12760 [Chloroflexota bacterium]